MDIGSLISMVQQHQWMLVAIMVIGFITRLLKDDTTIPINIPARWQPVLVLALGQASAILEMISSGVSWKKAVGDGLMTAFITMGLFDLVIKAIFNGKDLPPWLKWLVKQENNNGPTVL